MIEIGRPVSDLFSRHPAIRRQPCVVVPTVVHVREIVHQRQERTAAEGTSIRGGGAVLLPVEFAQNSTNQGGHFV